MISPEPFVFVIDDDSSVRRSLGRLFKMVGIRTLVFASADEFVRQPVPDAPACLILDVQMPGLSGMDLQRALAERNTGLPIVFLTGHGDIPTAVRAMKAGAVDFLAKPFNNQELVNTVRQALSRHARTRQSGAELANIQQRAKSLSPREREVMALVVSGTPNKLTGRRLGVTEKTIKVHRARVMEKMQVGSLAELVRLAEKMGAPPPKP